MSDILVIQVAFMACATIALVASMGQVRRYLEHRATRRGVTQADDLASRLDRIEQAVDATAIEVERLSESNRFVAKLLADRAGAPLPAASPPRTITPH